MFINIPNNVQFIIDTFYNNNYEAFMVGGCVRDCLLGLTPKDYDITTSALPNITESLFERTIPTGITPSVLLRLTEIDLQYYQYIIKSGVLIALTIVSWLPILWSIFKLKRNRPLSARSSST